MAQATRMLWNPRVGIEGAQESGVDSLRTWVEPLYTVPLFLLALAGLFVVPPAFAVLAADLRRSTRRPRRGSSPARRATGCRGTSCSRCSPRRRSTASAVAGCSKPLKRPCLLGRSDPLQRACLHERPDALRVLLGRRASAATPPPRRVAESRQLPVGETRTSASSSPASSLASRPLTPSSTASGIPPTPIADHGAPAEERLEHHAPEALRARRQHEARRRIERRRDPARLEPPDPVTPAARRRAPRHLRLRAAPHDHAARRPAAAAPRGRHTRARPSTFL